MLENFLQLCVDSGWYMVGVKIGEITSKTSKALLGSNHNKTLNLLRDFGRVI